MDKLIEKYFLSFEWEEEEEGLKYFESSKNSQLKSLPHLSCFNEDSQIGKTIIDLMREKIEEEHLTKYNLEWYWLANGCYFINYYITFPLMKKMWPDRKWYFCKTDFHSFVTNTNDLALFEKIPN